MKSILLITIIVFVAIGIIFMGYEKSKLNKYPYYQFSQQYRDAFKMYVGGSSVVFIVLIIIGLIKIFFGQ